MLKPREKALLHIYPDLAGIPDVLRRDVLRGATGCVTARDPDLDHDDFVSAMAAYETILWDRVDRGLLADPRDCTVCGRRLKSAIGNMTSPLAACPEGCERRRVYTWSRDYWRNRLPSQNGANSRQLWKLRQIWTLLLDYLPEEERTDAYLAGIVAHSHRGSPRPPSNYLEAGGMAWHKITPSEAHCAIEAIKDRLAHAVTQPTEVPF